MSVSEPTQDRPTYRCPCCGCKTLRGRAAFEICPVCWWEDDGQDEDDADLIRGGPNGSLSLRDAQQNYRSCGASEPVFVHRVRKPRPEEL
ncbi:MAG: hypothetical protein JF625_20540 [Inquilinus limosus]|uniref:Cysteine-rich CPCC domain-containing protein n=1 Tax=Inquilinus limosus TaxID=171674 RepID=A0A952FNC9_9PROT|nr:hypothetical protein [Inquilinus limosus]